MLPQITLDWFNTPYYYALYANRNEQEASNFIRTLFSKGVIEKGQKVLDLACGMGRHARVMHECGAEVLGIDYAEDVIAQAKQGEEPGLRFEVHDMLKPFPWAGFEVVTNLFTSFGYFTHPDNQRVLDNVAQCLSQGGILILDYLSAETVIRNLVPADEKSSGKLRFKMRRYVQDRIIFKRIEVLDDGEPAGTFMEGVQAYTRQDLEAMMVRAGLTPVAHFGTYELNSPHVEGQSPRLILVGRKEL